MKKAILFDLDGTLLNTDLLIKKSFIHTFKKYKPASPPATMTLYIFPTVNAGI